MRVLYSTDGKGNWWKRVWSKQCKAIIFSTQERCQGVVGHKGVHWNYNPSGCFCYDDNKRDSTENGCSGVTPPGHKDYREPTKMFEQYWNSHFVDTEVTSKTLITRLERGDTKPGETVIAPCSIEKLKNEKKRI